MAKYRYHVRSTSFPSTSHPLTARVEEQMNKLRVCETSSSTTEVLQDGFCGLKGLYESVEDLLQLRHTQQVLIHHRHEKWVDEVLDGSLRLLDVSGTIKDVLLQMKEQVQETQSALRRRRGGEFDLKIEISIYMLYRKKVNKEIRKILVGLNRMENKHASSTLLDKDHDLVAVLSVLREVEAITLSVCESLLSFISGTRTLGKPSGWSLVSKLMHNKRTACEERQDINVGEVEKVDVTLYALSRHKSSDGVEVALIHQNARKQLEALEARIKSFEEGLECVFRRLIKIRVSLLNILNN